MEIFLAPLSELCNREIIKCCCVYLLKATYTGPYLKVDSPRGENPILFRNFIHRHLLEFHFSQYEQWSDNIEVIFDRFEMSKDAINNLEAYLRGNLRIPNIKHITHANSLYVDGLQIANQLVNLVKDIVLNQSTPTQKELMRFINMKDITQTPYYV